MFDSFTLLGDSVVWARLVLFECVAFSNRVVVLYCVTCGYCVVVFKTEELTFKYVVFLCVVVILSVPLTSVTLGIAKSVLFSMRVVTL